MTDPILTRLDEIDQQKAKAAAWDAWVAETTRLSEAANQGNASKRYTRQLGALRATYDRARKALEAEEA